jgi:hypothetical protein
LIECYGEGFDIESLEIAFLHGSCDNEKLWIDVESVYFSMQKNVKVYV